MRTTHSSSRWSRSPGTARPWSFPGGGSVHRAPMATATPGSPRTRRWPEVDVLHTSGREELRPPLQASLTSAHLSAAGSRGGSSSQGPSAWLTTLRPPDSGSPSAPGSRRSDRRPEDRGGRRRGPAPPGPPVPMRARRRARGRPRAAVPRRSPPRGRLPARSAARAAPRTGGDGAVSQCPTFEQSDQSLEQARRSQNGPIVGQALGWDLRVSMRQRAPGNNDALRVTLAVRIVLGGNDSAHYAVLEDAGSTVTRGDPGRGACAGVRRR